MSLIARFVKQPELWTKAFIRREPTDVSIPFFALRAFTPDEREGDCLSLFRLKDEQDAASLAAAFWLTSNYTFALIAVKESELVEGGLALKETKGGTYHSEANDQHVDLMIKSAADCVTAATIFFSSGRLIPLEESTIRAQVANDNARGVIDFDKLAKDKKQPTPNKVCTLIEKRALQIVSL